MTPTVDLTSSMCIPIKNNGILVLRAGGFDKNRVYCHSDTSCTGICFETQLKVKSSELLYTLICIEWWKDF